MNLGRRQILAILGAAPLGARSAFAQQRLTRVVVLSLSRLPDLDQLRADLRELGWVEGRTLILEERHAGATARLFGLAVEVVDTRPDLIFAAGSTAAAAAKAATSSIPIVFYAPDPVGEGLVASLARPGGNLTGTASQNDQLASKRIELLREIVPSVRRIAILHTGTRGSDSALRGGQAAAARMSIEVIPVLVSGDGDVTSAVEKAAGGRAEGIVPIGATTFRNPALAAAALQRRLPLISSDSHMVEDGALASYGVDNRHRVKRTAALIDRLLKGAQPGDLPVEQVTRFELALNLRTARELGLTIPPSLVALADRVIE